jgi:hypothetical protein
VIVDSRNAVARVHVIHIKGLLRQPLFWFLNQCGSLVNVSGLNLEGCTNPLTPALSRREREKSDLFLEIIVPRVSAGKLTT